MLTSEQHTTLEKTERCRGRPINHPNKLACEQEGNDGQWDSEEESKDRWIGEENAQQTSGLKKQKAPAAATYSRRPHTAAARRSQVSLRQ